MSLDPIFPLFGASAEYHPIPRARSLVPYFSQKTRPDFYNLVLLENDDTAPSFKKHVLRNILGKNPLDAMRLMFELHGSGRVVAGRFPHEVADTKALQIRAETRRAGYRFEAVLERA